MINFDNILYTPLDIPLLPFSKRSQIVDLYQAHATNIEKPTDPNLPVFWKGITCYKGPSFTPEMLLHVGTFIDMADLFKEEIDIMNNHLPLEVETIINAYDQALSEHRGLIFGKMDKKYE